MELSGTSTFTTIRTTTANSPSGTSGVSGGTETSFNLTSFTMQRPVSPNENVYYESPQMVASTVNESQEMTGNKSFQLNMTLSY